MKNNNRLLYVIIGILLVWCLALSISLNEVSKSRNDTEVNELIVSGYSTDFTKVVADVRSAVVSVSYNGSLHSGFVYKSEESGAYIVTVIADKSDLLSADVSFDSSYKTKGEIIGSDLYTGVSVIRVDTPFNLETAKIGNSSLVKTGETVLVFGTPISLNYRGSVESGIVSDNLVAVNNEIEIDSQKIGYYQNAIELSSCITSAYSGAPVLNMSGRLIGICTPLSEEGIFVLPANEIALVADNIISSNDYRHNRFGIRGDFVASMPAYYRTQLNIPLETIFGYYVEGLKDNGIAYALGVKTGDVITEINGMEITDYNDLLKAIYSNASEFIFKVVRSGDELSLSGSVTGND